MDASWTLDLVFVLLPWNLYLMILKIKFYLVIIISHLMSAYQHTLVLLTQYASGLLIISGCSFKAFGYGLYVLNLLLLYFLVIRNFFGIHWSLYLSYTTYSNHYLCCLFNTILLWPCLPFFANRLYLPYKCFQWWVFFPR